MKQRSKERTRPVRRGPRATKVGRKDEPASAVQGGGRASSTHAEAEAVPDLAEREGGRWRLRLAVAVVVIAALVVASNGLRNEFILDDTSKIVDNPDLRDLAALPRKLVYPYEANPALQRNDPSRPLVYLVWGLLYAVDGANPAVFHTANAIVHALTGVLVFALARRVLQVFTGEAPLVGPLLGAVFFVTAPIQVGTATYAYSMSDLLGAALSLLSVYLFARERDPSPGTRALSVAAMCLALLAKQSSVVVPVLVLLYDVVLVGHRASDARSRLRYHAPYWGAVAVYLALRLTYFGGIGDLEAKGNAHGALDYFLTQPAAVLRYLRMTFVPVGLAIDHHVLPSTMTVAEKAVGFAGLAVAGTCVVVLWRRRTAVSRGCAYLFGFFLVAVSPTSSFLPTVDVLVERRVYLANAAIALGIAMLHEHAESLPIPFPKKKVAVLGVLAALAAVFVGQSLRRNMIYRTGESAWQNVLEVYPNNPRALNNLGTGRLQRGDFTGAKALFERLVARNPSDFIAIGNLGAIYGRRESPYLDRAKATELYLRVIALRPEDAEAHYNLGRLRQLDERMEEAEAEYARALALMPNHVLAHNNLGLLYARRGQFDDARREYETSLRIDPDCAVAKGNLAGLEHHKRSSGTLPPLGPSTARSGAVSGVVPTGPVQQQPTEIPLDDVPTEALVRLYEDHLRSSPSDAVVRRAYARLCRSRKLPCAREQYEILRQAAPDDPEVREALGAQ